MPTNAYQETWRTPPQVMPGGVSVSSGRDFGPRAGLVVLTAAQATDVVKRDGSARGQIFETGTKFERLMARARLLGLTAAPLLTSVWRLRWRDLEPAQDAKLIP